jgi:uncharacterized protein (TIGR03083 family)
MRGRDVLVAAELCRDLLTPVLTDDWSASVPGLDFTVASVIAHAATSTTWYALDLWSGPDDAAFTLDVRADAANTELATSLLAAAHVCAAAVDAAPPTQRGFHPFGPADPAGFAAMACDELLVHGDDAARGLGTRLEPDRDLAARVLARLFPWHQSDGDPWRTLLWANGRIDVAGRPFQHRWKWRSEPLADWDGAAPAELAR